MKSAAAIRKDEPQYQADGSEDVNVNDQLEVRVARIESDVQHIKEVTTDLRVELRRTNDKIDALDVKVDGKFSAVDGKFSAVDGKFSALEAKVDGKFSAVDGKFSALEGKVDGKFSTLEAKLDGLKDKLHSVTVWALLLYIALAGSLLTVLAKGFKWF
jgi:hypothetical protein